jgi:hypothetical protein
MKRSGKQTRVCMVFIDEIVASAEPGVCPLCLEEMPSSLTGSRGRTRRYCKSNLDCVRTFDRLYAQGRNAVYPEREKANRRRAKERIKRLATLAVDLSTR